MNALAQSPPACACGEPALGRRLGERSVSETVEEVVYVKQRIKHFNREGSEYWDEVSVPDLVEREVTRRYTEWQCEHCGRTRLLPVSDDVGVG